MKQCRNFGKDDLTTTLPYASYFNVPPLILAPSEKLNLCGPIPTG